MFRFSRTRPSVVVAGLAAALAMWRASLLCAGDAVAPSLPAQVDYTRDVRPILSNACFACHGPDEGSREADLRLDDRAGVSAIASSGSPVVAPGKPEDSELLRRIVSTNPDEAMPPPDSGKKLTPAEVAQIRRWIEQGAPWQAHWAFIAPQRTAVPQVSDESWPRTAIDRFIQATTAAANGEVGLRATPKLRQRQIDHADRELGEKGV